MNSVYDEKTNNLTIGIEIDGIEEQFKFITGRVPFLRRAKHLYKLLNLINNGSATTYSIALGYSLRLGGIIILQLFNDSQTIGYSILLGTKLTSNFKLIFTKEFDNMEYNNLLENVTKYINKEYSLLEVKEYD